MYNLATLPEDLVGELSIGQRGGQLQRPDHHGVDAEHLRVRRLRIMRRQAGGEVADDRQHAVDVHPLGGVRAAADLVQQGGRRATNVRDRRDAGPRGTHA